MDTIFELDKINLTKIDIKNYEEKVKKNNDPDNGIFIKLLLAVNGKPNYMDSIINSGPYEGYLGPFQDYCKDFFNIYKKNKNNEL